MGVLSKFKTVVNCCLNPFNLRLETLTADRVELARLSSLDKQGQFERAIFSTPNQFLVCDPTAVLDVVASFKENTRRFSIRNECLDYSYFNDYFSSPDAEIAYAIVRKEKPKIIVEVGSGNSTRLFRAAVTDAGLATEIVSIDPHPRENIHGAASRIISKRLEDLRESGLFDSLRAGDILFIDSSHEIRPGNDVVKLLLNVVPALRDGVLVHLHDIFLPYEYPRKWIIENRWKWNEQYLVQAMLQGSSQFEAVWPGHYLQRTLPDFQRHFAPSPQGVASSLWLRKVA